MKLFSSKWLWLCAFFLICTVTALAWIGGGSWEQKKTEARIHRYFALDSNAQLTDTSILAALHAHFPLETPVKTVEMWLGGQGLGKDGHSMTWQTNQMVYYKIEDYSDGFLSMRSIEVSILFNSEEKVQSFEAQAFSYSL